MVNTEDQHLFLCNDWHAFLFSQMTDTNKQFSKYIQFAELVLKHWFIKLQLLLK